LGLPGWHFGKLKVEVGEVPVRAGLEVGGGLEKARREVGLDGVDQPALLRFLLLIDFILRDHSL
jgi:hypothetical protein